MRRREMQTTERSTRSSLRVLAEKPPPTPAPAEPEPAGPDGSKSELTNQSQSHGGRKPFSCRQSFHHPAFLQIHEKSHDDPPGRGIATRSSKMADVVHVRPAHAKPRPLLNSVVKFPKEQKAEPAFTPRECVTRRSHGSAPSQRRDAYEKSHFQLRISKFSDTAVHLIDPFGNSIEILTDVFDSYTLSDEEEAEPSIHVDETSTSSAPEGRAAPEVPPEAASIAEMDTELPLHQAEPPAGGTSSPELESASGEISTSEVQSDSSLRESNVGRSPAPEKPQPPDAASSPPIPAAEKPVDPAGHDVPMSSSDEAISQSLCVPEDTYDHMDTSPEAGESGDPPNESADLPNKDPDVLSRSEQPAAIAAPPEKSVHEDGLTCPSDALPSMSDDSGPAADERPEVATTDGQQRPDSALPAPQAQVDRQVAVPSPDHMESEGTASSASAPDQVGKMLTSDQETSLPRSDSKEGRPATEPGDRGGGDTPPPEHEGNDTEPQSSEDQEEAETALSSPEVLGDASISVSKAQAQQDGSREPEKSEVLAEKPLLQDEELGIGDKPESGLFQRELFQLEVREQEDDNCLDGSNMKYISESEMIRLLEQDKDEAAVMEPLTRQAMDDRPASKPSMDPPTSTLKWGEKENVSQQDKSDSDLSLHLILQPGAGNPEAQGPAKSLVLSGDASDDSISPTQLTLPPELRSSSGEESNLPQAKQPNKHSPHEQNVGGTVTPEKRPSDKTGRPDKTHGTVPDNAGIVSKLTEQSEKLGGSVGGLSSSCEEIKDHVPLTDPDEVLQALNFQDIEPLRSNVPGQKQSTRDDQSGDQASASEIDKGLVANQREDKLDLNSTQKSPQRKVKENNSQEKLVGEFTPNLNLEASSNLSLDVGEDLTELTPVLHDEAEEDLENFLTPAKNLSSPSKDNDQDSPGDFEVMEEGPEDNTPNRKTRERPVGTGAECLKCGRRIRRSRKEMVWSPVCFKCRMVAKKKERLSNHSESSEPQTPLREEGPPAKSSVKKIKRQTVSLPEISNLLSPDLDPGGKKLYKCPKCDKAFKIPALLAGHIKCHTLPQCLTCGCQIPLKYKTKRIPRRCQKCIQKLRDGKKVSQESGDEQSGTSDNEDLSEVPDVSSEDTGGVSQKSRKDPFELPEDSADENDVAGDGEKSRVCPQCDKAFKCNRSLNLHLLSHSTAQCETCGCRLQKKRRAGRWSKKCRICKLQGKGQLSREGDDQTPIPVDKASKRLKAKQAVVSQKRKMQSIIKQKKELKWKNMLLAVKKLMNKSKKRKELAAQSAESEKKKEDGSEKCEAASVNDDKTSICDQPKPKPQLSDTEEISGPSGVPSAPNKTPKQGRKCLYKEKNIIKVEEDDVLPCSPDVSILPDLLKEEELWQCLECNQNLETLEALLSHQPSHIDGESFTCPQCPQVFSSEEYVSLHTPTHENRPFQCPECDKTFTKRNHLGVHLRVHSGSRPFACSDCPRRFRQKATLLSHRYSHKNFELLLSRPHQCSVCNKSFKQKERLVVHERLHTGECPFSCKDCDKVFPSKARLNVHRKLHKLEKAALRSEQEVTCKEEEGPFHCQDCEKICSTKASFALHRKVHKLSSEQKPRGRPFYCIECDKPFASKATLSMHLKNHSAHKADSESNADLKQSFPCKDCDKVCVSKSSLVLHRKMHQSAGEQNLDVKVEGGTPSFTCKDCDKVCTTKASLALHSKVHKSPSDKEQASNDGEAPSFKCKKCTMTFSTKASFILHKKTHKPASLIQKKRKNEAESSSFHCKRCDMVFTTKASLLLHRKEHRLAAKMANPKADEEPQYFTCKDCDKVCATKASLVLHSKIHKTSTGEENAEAESEGPFVCKDCEKVCSTKASYVLHRKVHRSSSSERNPGPKGGQEESSFQCKECERKFSTKGRLSFHRFKKHGEPPEQSPASEASEDLPKKVSEDKLFSCTICGLRFTKLKTLVQHKAIHGDRTATPCTHCGKRFLYKKSLLNHMKICQSKTKGKKLLLLKKAAAAKRKLAKEEGGSVTEEETAQKKSKTEEKKKAKPKAKNQPEKTKKANKEKAKAKSEPKTKEKRAKPEAETSAEDEGKKSAPEKPSEVKPEKSSNPAPKEQSGKEKKEKHLNPGKTKRAKKDAPKEKAKSAKKVRVTASTTVKKKKLQAVILGGKKKLLVKKRVPLKPKPGAKSGQSAKEN